MLQYGMSAREAAIAVCRDFSLSEEDKGPEADRKRKSSEWEHKRHLDAAKGKEWGLHCSIKHAANDLLSMYLDPSEDVWNDPAFISALEAREQAECNLDTLQRLTKEELAERYSTADQER